MQDCPYSVALVVDPAIGEALRALSDRIHTWVVSSPHNDLIVDSIWMARRGNAPSIASGVTKFQPAGDTRAQWCLRVIGTLDEHHNAHSHHPGYTALEVYGVDASDEVKEAFGEYGFTSYQETAHGFIAKKN